ncbi:MAG: class V aminotransferase, partial [Alphaproteobacteria bacterium]|nr:class V aminotransferase [Alphaproteobacteria bacterium]
RDRLQARLAETPLGTAEVLNPEDASPLARFLALRSPDAAPFAGKLADREVMVDVRDDVLRIGLALYHDAADVDEFIARAASI